MSDLNLSRTLCRRHVNGTADGDSKRFKIKDEGEAGASSHALTPRDAGVAGVQQKGGAKVPRIMDFSKYAHRVIILEFFYVGWMYRGLARQTDMDDTIEHHLFNALRRLRLVPDDAPPESLAYRFVSV